MDPPTETIRAERERSRPPSAGNDLVPLGPISIEDSGASHAAAPGSGAEDGSSGFARFRPHTARVPHDDITRVQRRSSASLPVSSFDAEPSVDLASPRTSRWVWLGVGLGGAAVAQAAAWWFFHAADTFGGALLFSVGALAGFVSPLFLRHDKEIWSRTLTAGQADRLLLTDLLVLFFGLIAGYALAPLVIGIQVYADAFSGIARFVDVRRVSLAAFDFSGVWGILVGNLQVLAAFFLIGLLFRYVGTLIAVVYNAATWGVVFAAALAGGFGAGKGGGFVEGLQLAAVAMPHILVEVVAYVAASMAGIFLSRALVRYRWTGERFRVVGNSVLRLIAIGAALVLVAAVLEGLWGRWLAGMWWRAA